RVHIDYEIPDDILFSQWCKFVLNVGVNQVSAVLRAPYGDFQRSAKVHALALDLMREAVQIAEQVGIHNTAGLLPWCENFIRNTPPAFKSSMLQDIEAGKKTEVDLFGGAICALGAKYGIPTPENAMFVRLIRALDEMASKRESE
ncbi:MAG TPA: ketopantoate reductase C-terminal domain-containing protein, partial [Phototrophicaceae bacterium]|nr:ketopantoate reductase C-terminal domain-containing protein [Phototrophicaceae bacterium]